jgi:hypothetical protein
MSEIIGKKIELFQPLLKSNSNGQVRYEAVLSDDSTDRDDEIVGYKALSKIKDSDVIVGLMDHENKILNQVCEWVNKRLEKRDGHNAYVAEPKWFMSNPNAVIIKGMLDDGASVGISIGAIVKEYEDQTMSGVKKRVYTELEVLEASFVGVPANKHARIMAIAKMFKSEDKMVDKTYSEKEYSDITKKVDDLNKEIATMKTSSVKEKADLEKQFSDYKVESEKKLKESIDKFDSVNKELEKIKNMPWYKGNFSEGGNDTVQLEKEMDDQFKKGAIPVVRK